MLANQIVNLRKKAGMSQLQLAEKLNVGPSAIGMYEQGRRTPALDILIQMAILFDVSLDYLVTGREMLGSITDEKDAILKNACLCRRCCFCLNRFKLRHINYLCANDIYEGENDDILSALSSKSERKYESQTE